MLAQQRAVLGSRACNKACAGTCRHERRALRRGCGRERQTRQSLHEDVYARACPHVAQGAPCTHRTTAPHVPACSAPGSPLCCCPARRRYAHCAPEVPADRVGWRITESAHRALPTRAGRTAQHAVQRAHGTRPCATTLARIAPGLPTWPTGAHLLHPMPSVASVAPSFYLMVAACMQVSRQKKNRQKRNDVNRA